MNSNYLFRRASGLAGFAAAALCGFAHSGAAQTSDFVWIEAQNTATANLKPKVQAWNNAQLSGGDFAEISIDAAKVEAELPAEGVVWSYDFNLARAGKQQIWNRIGGEWVRSPFEWRVDGGAWKTVSPDDLTTDLQELSQWNEIAWLQMGERDLAAGAHKLEIRLSKTLQTEGKDKDKTARVFYRSDAIVVAPDFRPNGPFKPDETGRDANDEAAAKNVFQLPEPKTPGARASVFLNGSWEVARHDEQMPKEVAAPITDFPAAPIWKAIAVPSDKNKARPDLVFAHRLWYRTRVNVPASQIGRSFGLKFPQNSLNTTIYVNGQFCGFGKNPQAPLQFDVTQGIKAGQNEIWVGIKDAWYGFSANPDDPMKLRHQFNRPIQSASGGWTDLSYPVWADFKSGILATPEFFVSGAVYAGKKRAMLAGILRNLKAPFAGANRPCRALNSPGRANTKAPSFGRRLTPNSGTIRVPMSKFKAWISNTAPKNAACRCCWRSRQRRRRSELRFAIQRQGRAFQAQIFLLVPKVCEHVMNCIKPSRSKASTQTL